MKTHQNKKFLCLSIACLSGLGVFLGAQLPDKEAGAISLACQRSAACREAAAKEQAANQNAAAAANSANAYQIKVNETMAEIAAKEAEIAETETEIDELKGQITRMEKKIDDEQEALAELLVRMHFEADAEPIRILAGATSISDLAEKAAREAVAREQINTQAIKIKEDKKELEASKEKVEERLAAQQQARTELVQKRQEHEELVAKYQNDAEAYEEVAAAAREEKQAAERAWQEQNQGSFSGLAYYSGDNTYPWQADCPAKQDYYLTFIEGRKIGGYVCECVSYAGWKAYERYGVIAAWGHAYSWASGARNAGYRVDNTPAEGTIGQMGGAPYGHVFWVESVNGDGSINVTEYNNASATYLYSGHSHYGDFGARTIPASEVGRYNYIHF